MSDQPLNDSQLAEELRNHTKAANNREVLERLNARLTPPIQLVVTQHATGEIDIGALNGGGLDIQVVQQILSNAQAHLLRTVVGQIKQAQAQSQAQLISPPTPQSESTVEPRHERRRRSKRPS